MSMAVDDKLRKNLDKLHEQCNLCREIGGSDDQFLLIKLADLEKILMLIDIAYSDTVNIKEDSEDGSGIRTGGNEAGTESDSEAYREGDTAHS